MERHENRAAHLAFFSWSSQILEEVPVLLILSIFDEFLQHMGAWRGGNVHIVPESSTITRGTRERVFLRGHL